MIFKLNLKRFLLYFLVLILIFFIDRITKIYVINLDKKFIGYEIFSSKYVNITLIWNEGIAFGLLSFDQENLYNLLTILIILIIFFILVMVLKSSGLKKLALVMILGGALGNVFDRILYKSVPDFIDFHVGEFHWFIFNIADVFITIGVFSMILFEFIGNNQKIEENEKF